MILVTHPACFWWWPAAAVNSAVLGIVSFQSL